jgi:5-hydroxyisourate hydrolase-like protein (transthyretin family)
MSGNAPRTYISEPLPLGGTYEIIGWRDNSFCSSGPITLTGAVPAPAVEMSIPAGQDITGRVLLPDGQPARNASVGNEGDVDEHSFGLKSVFTDADGNFRLTDCSPTVANYSLNISEPGCAAVMVKVNFKRLPLTAKLEPGLKLSGQVIEAATGKLLADAEVRVYPVDGSHPMVTARTDANGNYQFDTLAKTKYYINVSGGNLGDNYDNTFEVGGVTNLVLKVTPYPGGELTEKSGER